jgi:hypothetical protein
MAHQYNPREDEWPVLGRGEEDDNFDRWSSELDARLDEARDFFRRLPGADPWLCKQQIAANLSLRAKPAGAASKPLSEAFTDGYSYFYVRARQQRLRNDGRLETDPPAFKLTAAEWSRRGAALAAAQAAGIV